MNETGSLREDVTVRRSGELQLGAEDHVLRARQRAREVAESEGFSITDVTRIVTAVSELARNIHLYAGDGTMSWRVLEDGDRDGLEITFDDDGPGIDDVEGVLAATHSTSDGMGRGIQGTRKLMDEFWLSSSTDTGTTVTIRKWQ
ncbi:putative anti-sigma regulatory factor, serine/threonine protein kinase [Halorhabdus utahensis DSM 12940]|uniref:Putative anti-sigma regulatory factor, serine/threonine protein kinase n=1 Tax=Halorhabdus utahensis (strain DSM 12940 / JCM 11049 / AX-2) TaxID=519442 RepID=C7NPT8_HALUD|nr:anti-sigma regulatory factor [Halorhabdus utahensis]ACV10385.1 putative anti-sigma regulatory factor, serine/threonine protein kinase [Halorhabdus utahensis DSM 12940]